MNDALDFILKSASHAKGTEIFVPKLKSYVLSDIKNGVSSQYSNSAKNIKKAIEEYEYLFDKITNNSIMSNIDSLSN